MRRMIRTSSTPSRPGMASEARRDLDRRGWPSVCEETEASRHRSGRSIRRERLDYCVPLDDGSHARTNLQAPVPPTAETGLRAPCRLMVDKLTAVPRKRLGQRVGSLAAEDLRALNRAVFVFLGLSETV